MDRIGLLALLTRALEDAGAEIAWAKVNTFGSTATDVFCVTVPVESVNGSGDCNKAARDAVEEHLLAVLGASARALVVVVSGDTAKILRKARWVGRKKTSHSAPSHRMT